MLGNYRVVVIGSELDDGVTTQLNALKATVLLPPYDAVMAEMDNNIEAFSAIYTQHLFQKAPSYMMAAIIKALMCGSNILLYLTVDEAEMLYSKFLLNHLRVNYGIIVGTTDNPFFYDVNYNWAICSLLYSFDDLMSTEEFFMLYPPTIQIPQNIILKLIDEVNPYIEERSLENYNNYFFEYKERIKRNNNRFVINPISR
jgi:hypothetical protein